MAMATGSDERVHISSLLLQVTPRGREALLSAQLPPGTRVHATSTPSKLIVALAAADEQAAAAAASALLQIPGVLTVSVVAHLSEMAAREESV